MRMSPGPKINVGLTTAHCKPDWRTTVSARALAA